MNSLSKLISLLLITGIVFFSASCKSTRSTLKKPLKEYGFNYLYSKMLENHIQFDYLNAKMNISYQEDRKTTDFKGQLRIRKDSLIWISFSPALGIEAARLSLSNDSIKFINRLNKTFLDGKYELVDERINTTIDYSILESMIIGNDITQYDVNKYRASIDGGLYRITIQERKRIKQYLQSDEIDTRVLVQNIWLDPETFRIRQVDLKDLNDGDNKKLEVYYENYQEVDGQLFPGKVIINISSQKSINIDVDFSKVELNQSLRFPFKIPTKYERQF
jgi:hypothetical protein